MSGQERRMRRRADGRASGARARALLEALWRAPGYALSAELLLEAVYGPGRIPPTGAKTMRTRALKINEALGVPLLEIRGPRGQMPTGYRLLAGNIPPGLIAGRKPRRYRRPIKGTKILWTEEEVAYLRELAPHHTILETTKLTNARFGRERAAASVRSKAVALRIQIGSEILGLGALAQIFGENPKHLVRKWIQTGYLRAEQRAREREQDEVRRPSGYHWSATLAEVRRFIREHPYAYEVARMRQSHPLAALAREIERERGYLTAHQARRRLGLGEMEIYRLLNEGAFAGALRLRAHGDRGGQTVNGEWRIPTAAVERYRAEEG